MPIDFKKIDTALYQPKTRPEIVDVPAMTFIAVDGQDDPNTSEAYVTALEMLYGLSYTIKMANKVILEYVVPPLEGFWEVQGDFDSDSDFRGSGAAITDKSKFVWTMLIRQPDFVTAEVFEVAKAKLAQKKPELPLEKARLVRLTEGLCVQVMHVGPYDDEPATIARLDQFAAENGYALDISSARRHHEIYLSDPRKVAPEKMKTVLRHPIRENLQENLEA